MFLMTYANAISMFGGFKNILFYLIETYKRDSDTNLFMQVLK